MLPEPEDTRGSILGPLGNGDHAISLARLANPELELVEVGEDQVFDDLGGAGLEDIELGLGGSLGGELLLDRAHVLLDVSNVSLLVNLSLHEIGGVSDVQDLDGVGGLIDVIALNAKATTLFLGDVLGLNGEQNVFEDGVGVDVREELVSGE